MIIDGKELQRELKGELHDRLQALGRHVSLAVIVTHETAAVRTFVELKRKFAAEIGVGFTVLQLGALEQTTEKVLQTMIHATKDHDGVVVQLPVPPRIELTSILNLFPLSHDVDVLGYTAFQQYREGSLPIMPPVVAAMAEILHRQGIRVQGKKVLVIGEGRLVGEPAAIWVEQLGATLSVANVATVDLHTLTLAADVIISGAGTPGLITADMVKDGVVLLDAGTSDVGGVLKGDVDPACAQKALLFTPTPGGIGPVTIAKLFENLLVLAALKSRRVTP